ncbi:MAG: LamG domain-containing protein, partial [Thermoplasmata archaeon]|nr:LamG domain-containing protein [Thermoplasmata archaeon]
MKNKLMAFGITLLMVFACFIIVPDSAEAAVFTDLGGPADTTFRDVMWEENGDYAMVVGNDSLNGVTYRYQASDESWSSLTTVPGDSYNAVSKTEPYIYFEDVDNGTADWSTNTWQVPDIDPLIAEWKFEEAAGTDILDTSQNSHDGVWVNTPTRTDGISENALYFGGSNYATVPNAAHMTNGSFSGSVWVNISTHIDFTGIVNKYSSGGWGLWDKADGTTQLYFLDEFSVWTIKYSSALTTNEWHHLAWSYNLTAATVSFYIDGELDYSSPSINPVRHKDTLDIGMYNSNCLDGRIDEVRLYDIALTPKQISDYYNETANKVGEWKFDEGSGAIAKDTSQHENDGTLVLMDDTNWVGSPAKTGLMFNGFDEFVNCGDKPQLNLSNTFTIEAWIYMMDNNDWHCIVSKASANSVAGISYHFRVSNLNLLQIYMSNGATTELAYSNTALNTGEWYHVAAVATGTEYQLYLNGQPDGTDAQTFTPQVISADFRIGSHANTNFFDGAIDEVNVWNYSLSASDINDSYNRTVANYFENYSLGGDWSFEEGVGGNAYDSGIYGNDGALVNMDDTNWVDGISGKALDFDGSTEWVSCGNDPSLDITDRGTVEAWVYPRTEGDNLRVVTKGNNYEISMNSGSPHKWTFWVTGGQTATSTSDVSLDNWTHIAATYDESFIKIYINGVEEASTPKSGSLTPDASIFSIGTGSGYYFDGIIDEVKVWQRYFEPSEVMESYLSMLTPGWHVIDPSTLPIPGSGTQHGTANSGSNIAWYGIEETGNYNNGERTNGSLVSPAIYLPKSNFGLVVFNHWFDVESINPNVDVMSVSIKNTTDSDWYTLKTWDSDDVPISSWTQELLYIHGWTGNFVQVNFTFDSIDGTFNDFAGWHIDDFALYTSGTHIVVGDVPELAGSSIYSIDLGGGSTEMTGMNPAVDFNDVAAGSTGSTFVAVGDSGVAQFWNNSAWFTLTGID